jgi:hypothetical protein
VSTESVFITAVVDAHKERDVACYDILGAFLHADSDEDITMLLKEMLVELMVYPKRFLSFGWTNLTSASAVERERGC